MIRTKGAPVLAISPYCSRLVMPTQVRAPALAAPWAICTMPSPFFPGMWERAAVITGVENFLPNSSTEVSGTTASMYRVSTKIRSKYCSVMALESSGFRRVSIQTTPFHRARRHAFSAFHLGKAGWNTRCTRRSGRRSLCACGWTFPRNTQPPPARPAATR